MSVLTYSAGALFILRVIKSLTTNPDNQWANSYEFRAQDAGSEAGLLTLAEAVVAFETALHRDVVAFQRVIVSTWAADSVPYDPTAFISSSLSVNGGVGPVGDNLPLNQCLSVARVCNSGRFGHIFYRGVLNEADTEAPAGRSVLTDRPGIQDNIDAALTSSGLDAYIGVAPDGDFGMCLVSATGTGIRPVTFLKAQGVSSVPQDHAWFNRT